MSILTIVKRLPEYAADIKSNLIELFSGKIEGLSEKQTYGVALTTAYCLQNEEILNDIRNEAKIHLTEEDSHESKMSVIIMSMECTHDNFISACNNKKLLNINAEFNKQTFSELSKKTSVLLYSLAVAILNNSTKNIAEISNQLLKRQVEEIALIHVGKIVAALKAASETLKIESVRSYEFLPRDSF